MKLDQLRKVIREEVKTAVQEGLQEIMNEAVRAASEPQKETFYEEAPYGGYKGPHTTNLASTDDITKNLQESGDPIMNLLEETRVTQSTQQYKNPSTSANAVHKPNFASMMAGNMGMSESVGPEPGLDITQFDFIKKAGSIYKKSVEIDKKR